MRAFREHRTNVGVLPIIFIVRILRARRTVWLLPIPSSARVIPSKLARYLSGMGAD